MLNANGQGSTVSTQDVGSQSPVILLAVDCYCHCFVVANVILATALMSCWFAAATLTLGCTMMAAVLNHPRSCAGRSGMPATVYLTAAFGL